MRRGLLAAVGAVGLLLGVLALAEAPATQTQAPEAPADISPQRALLDQYCVTCHNQRIVDGTASSGLVADQLRQLGLTLDTADVENVAADPELWENVVRKLRVGAMPPPPRPRPDRATYDGFRRWLEDELDRAAEARPNPGRTAAFHRLNQAEYRNVIRDLLDLDVDVASLIPPDSPDQHGFDNIATSLSLSPVLLERYVSAARKISLLAIGAAPAGGAVIDVYDVPLNLMQTDQQSEDLPFGSRGGAAIRHHFPVDGEYRIKLRLQTNYVGYVRGIDDAHDVEVRLDGERVGHFTFGGEAPGLPAPISFAGNIRGSDDWEHYTQHAGDELELTLFVPAGPHTMGVAFPRETWVEEGVLQPRQTGFALAINDMPDGNPALSSVEITGPLSVAGPGDTPTRRRIFTCRPAPDASEAEARACAREILSALARRAYRRPVEEADVATLLEFYDDGPGEDGFEAGIQFALERLLADPDFLFRVVRDPVDATPNTGYPISDVELASRLSFFLWSSIPDDQLLDAAEEGTLSNPDVLEQQVRRMMADPRSQAMVDNFVGQWLYVRNMRGVYPDPNLFPHFDENLREAFQRETELFIGNQLREDRSLRALLSADYTYVNERLAEHYGIPNVYGSRFRRVDLDGVQRGGLLGQGSVLTVTSYPNRTSPVLRGKWVLENLLGAAPPEPPPDIPALDERTDDGAPRSLREAMIEHRENPACSVCHAPMDPIGFALQNYDAIGGWRDTNEGGDPVDASGVLPDGGAFTGRAELTDLLLDRPEDFVGTVTEKLLMYALGRGVEYYDAPVVRRIVREAAGDDYRWSAIILGIVQSDPFQMRRSDS